MIGVKTIIFKVRTYIIFFLKGKFIQGIYYFIFRIIGLLPAKKDVVIFESFMGKQHSDNPRAIYEYMIEHNYNYQMYWSFDRRVISKQEKSLNRLKRLSFKWLWIMPRAKYWITNSRLPLWIPKPKHTIYIQTWHGTPLKRLAMDMEYVHIPGTNAEQYKKDFVRESLKWDYLVSPNLYSTNIFKRAFLYDNEVIESGYPRNDYLINNNNMDYIYSLKEKLQLPLDKKVILYAPTWRDNSFSGIGSYKFSMNIDLQALSDKLGDQYVVLLRMHYLIADHIELPDLDGFVYDYSNYDDIRDLYLISDILITDYSSVFFDYAILKRPMLFFTQDIEEYRDKLRGFYFDFEKTAPGPLVNTTNELIEEINRIMNGEQLENKNISYFFNQFSYLEDGKASERVVQALFKK